MQTPLEKATEYTRRGWATIPLVPGQKGAHVEKWQELRLTESDLPNFFKPDSNVGILLGKASGGLVDVDCDTPEAIICAKELLPGTLTSGRGSSISHFWYISDDYKTLKFKDLDGAMLVELRGDEHQTAVAPSIHPSGEEYKWFNTLPPTRMGYGDLAEKVTSVATATLIARHLPRGGRHDLALSLAGFLLKKLDDATTLSILNAAWKANGAPHGAYKDLRDIVDATREKIDNDEPHTGKKALDDFLPGFAGRIARYFGWTITASDPTGRTDDGNARLFIDRYGEECKYVWEWKKWAFWNGKRWERDEKHYVKYLCGLAIKSLYAEAAVSSTDDGAKLAKHALSSLSVGKIKAALEVAAAHPGMTISADEFDTNDFLLNCANGTLDLNTGKIRPHNKKDYITRLVPTEYHAEAKAPRFEAFMQEILPNPDTREFVHKAIGYSLTGDTAERCLFIAQGDGTNGKSTLMNLCADVLGDYAARAGTEVFLEKPAGSIPNDVAQLKGPRLVLASEVEQGKRLSEAQVKNFTGGSDKLVGRFLYGELFEFEPKFTAWILTNPLPRIKGTDPAIWNRLRIIPFHVVPKKIDKKLPKKLMREAEGVLAWMVRGFQNYTNGHLEPPTEVSRMRDQYRVNEDSVARFLEEACMRGPACRQSLIELFEAFREWAVDTEEWKMSRRLFNQRLDNLGCGTIGQGARAIKTDVQLLDPDRPDTTDEVPDPDPLGDGSEGAEGPEGEPVDAVEAHTGDDREGEAVSGTAQGEEDVPGRVADAGEGLSPRLANRAEDGAQAYESGAVSDADRLPIPVNAADKSGVVDVWAIDTETTGLNPRSDRVRLLQVWNPSRQLQPEVYNLDKDYDLAQDQLHAIRESDAPLVFHNAAFDLPFLEQSFPGVYRWTEGRVKDTMILSQLVYAGLRMRHGLDACLERELGIQIDKTQQTSDWSGPLTNEQMEYAKRDVRHLPALLASLAESAKDRGIADGIVDLEFNLTPVLAQMSDRGLQVDVEGWKQKAHESAGIVEFCELEIKNILLEHVPEDMVEDVDDLNLGSPQQIQRVFVEAGVWLPDTKDSTLAAVDDDLGLMKLLRQHRKATKLRNSYGLSWLRNVEADGAVHPRWKQTTTATGRMACADPNIQQIPRDDAFRRLFHARPGHKFVVADYSQIELRIAAKIAKEPIMLKAYREGTDLHKLTASLLLNKDVSKVTKDERQLAKAVNFGLLYGMGARKLQVYAKTEYGVDLTFEEASRYRNRWLTTYRWIRSWHEREGQNLRLATNLTIKTLAGRIRNDVDLYTERLNTPVQGSGADGLKAAVLRVQREGYKPVALVHDELVVEVPVGESDAAKSRIEAIMVEEMERMINVKGDPVPVEVEGMVSSRWEK